MQSLLEESRSFPPPESFTAAAKLKAEALAVLHQEAAQDLEGFWGRLAKKHLHWQTPFRTVLNRKQAPHYRWFEDGCTNASINCLDRHLGSKADKTAIRFEGERGEVRTFTYAELHAAVCQLANGLKALGIEIGDRVVIYLPHTPEAVIAMLACARIGAIHSVVFGGFSAVSLKDRIEDACAKLLITADGGWRGGQIVDLYAAAREALSLGCASIQHVLVLERTGHVALQPEHVAWQSWVQDQPTACDPVWVPAEHPLFLLYTSGSTGKPKGIQHSTGGYLLGALLTAQWVFDLQASDVFWCTADVGWITGHSYVCYGPLLNGATILIYEGAPTVPDAGRFWKIIQDHRVTTFYTAPTAIRALMRLGDDWPQKYDLSSLRLLGSVGEPINPEAWMWYRRVIGQERLPIVDTWWQTETGCIQLSPVPAHTATKPGSCTTPLPGVFPALVDESGHLIEEANVGGALVLTQPWPSMLRTIWGDDARYVETYWAAFQNRYYVAGDSARRDEDGYYWIMGRMDDVLNVSGHRIGTMEVESALVSHPRIAEAAVVGRPHEIKGEAICAFVVCKGARPVGAEAAQLIKALREHVAKEIGAIAKPDDIRLADGLPKTRSGKIMRRLLRSIAKGEGVSQDVSTLENPAIVQQLMGAEALK